MIGYALATHFPPKGFITTLDDLQAWVIYLLNIASKDKREQVLKHLHTTNQLLQKAAATLEGDGFCNLNGHVIAFEIRQRGIRLLKLNLAPNMPQILDVCVKAATRFAKSANGYCFFSLPTTLCC